MVLRLTVVVFGVLTSVFRFSFSISSALVETVSKSNSCVSCESNPIAVAVKCLKALGTGFPLLVGVFLNGFLFS